jgi:hypothetical protein
MSERLPFVPPDRRHPRVSTEELRRQLKEADEERYRLRAELERASATSAVATPPAHARRATDHRWAVGVGALLLLGAVGSVVWEMCPPAAHAGRARAVRVEAVTVTASVVNEPASPVESTNAPRRDVKVSAIAGRRAPAPRAQKSPRSVHHAARILKPAPTQRAPRPLSPGEFGRKAL